MRGSRIRVVAYFWRSSRPCKLCKLSAADIFRRRSLIADLCSDKDQPDNAKEEAQYPKGGLDDVLADIGIEAVF